MDELDIGSVEEQGEETPRPQASHATEPAQILHWSDLQHDAEWEETESSDDEDEAITPDFDGENDEEHALGRVQSHVVERAKAPVHTVPVVPVMVTPELKHSDATEPRKDDVMSVHGTQQDVAIVNSEVDHQARKNYLTNGILEKELVVVADVQ
ncbi:hypothetical protein CLAFUW4_06383 [Fulvia fulva]|uniref:Uncharacterized protein n=1 Tax=Passalora fulva TaxID=5499 RepID=A0A9Q8LHL9_PASFU|nr:uncharacterized protein CLAFUR5_06527 [Fulvia fulva]KAK4623827.1 hypothetical protein CLAFUR4_06386 [Fulvia fulva]KAK4625524.1 hypothetical protein CLAFUR0_06387 [Fulvia fulva]UJO17796.1 hypothetical protein CLAFUR5_06527 [Fulvia fulva]WPV14643.1 hypothetical protein CLAFUW4_06383 [Fulvia fulva]WPV30564.1 hypothetical protein CLAFUW7_06381 [Fulvia fulva]